MTSRKLTFTETTQLYYANTLHWLTDDTTNTTTNTTLTYPAFTTRDYTRDWLTHTITDYTTSSTTPEGITSYTKLLTKQTRQLLIMSLTSHTSHLLEEYGWTPDDIATPTLHDGNLLIFPAYIQPLHTVLYSTVGQQKHMDIGLSEKYRLGQDALPVSASTLPPAVTEFFTRHDSTLTTDSTFYVLPSLSMDAFAARTIWGMPVTPTSEDNQRLYDEQHSMVYDGADYTVGERLSLPVPTMYL